MNLIWRGIFLVLFASGWAMTSMGHEPERDPQPSAAQLEAIKSQSLRLLENIVPRPALFQSSRTLKMLRTSEGTVRWGNLFDPSEVTALVNLAPEKPQEIDEIPPQYLCFFSWTQGRWTFRQFLGNAYNLEIHFRKDIPTAYLQGSRQTGRYDGDHLSWSYDRKNRSLKRTYFESWGPFYLIGNYLVTTRGFERLSHDSTTWIYPYKNGVKGDLIAVFHGNDMGSFDVVFRNAKSGKMESWHFKPDQDDGSRTQVIIREGVKEDGDYLNPKNSGLKTRTGQLLSRGNEGLPLEYCFQLLTGLNPIITGYGEGSSDLWLEKLPPDKPVQRLPIEATGDPRVIEVFQWPKPNRNESK